LVVQPVAAGAAERAATSTPPDAALSPRCRRRGAEEAALVRELDAGSIAAG
jgi:hypothetical protein